MANNPPGTYYVNQAGSGAGDGSSVANARSVANHNSDTWNAPSIIYLLDTITSGLIPPSSGASNTDRIVYRGDYIGQLGVFDMGAAATIPIFINGKSNITVTQMSLKDSSDNLVALGGTSNNITLSYLDLSEGTAARDIQVNAGDNIVIDNCTFHQGEGLALIVASSATNFSFTNNTLIGAAGKTPAQCLYLYNITGLVFTGNIITDWTLDGAAYLVYIRNVTGGTLANNTIGTTGHGNNGRGYVCQASTGLTFDTDIVTESVSTGFYIDATSTATLTNCQSVNCGADGGFYILNNTTLVNCTSDGSEIGFHGGTNTATGCISKNGSTGFSNNAAITTLTSCVAYDNDEDGFSGNLTGTMTCIRCLSYNNGSVGSATSGDGFTCHDSSEFNAYNCIAYNNRKSGIAITGTGNSNLYNNTCYNNYAAEKAGTGGGIYSSKTGGTINIKNNITANHDLEINIAAIAGVTYALDYNCYYDSMTGIDAFVFNGTGYANFAAYRAAHATQDVHSINENPDWVSVITPDFHLTIASPQQPRNGGVNVGLTTDYNGDVVPFGGGFPMGAYRGPALNSPMGLSPGLSGGGKIPLRRRRR